MNPTAAAVFRNALGDGVFLVGWHIQGLRVRGSRPRVSINHRHDPILILPGVYESPHFLDPLAAVIRTTGRPVHTVGALRRNRGRITDSAMLVRRYVEACDLRNVTIVAHSKGGLIGKQLMVWPETSNRIRSMIAVATPFGGSRYAMHAPTRVLRDFSPLDATVRELAANGAANAAITSIFGPLDPQIPDGSRLTGARNILLATPGHFRPLGTPQLHRLLRVLLTAEVASSVPLNDPPFRLP
jgi:hypothetical protein